MGFGAVGEVGDAGGLLGYLCSLGLRGRSSVAAQLMEGLGQGLVALPPLVVVVVVVVVGVGGGVCVADGVGGAGVATVVGKVRSEAVSAVRGRQAHLSRHNPLRSRATRRVKFWL